MFMALVISIIFFGFFYFVPKEILDPIFGLIAILGVFTLATMVIHDWFFK